MRRVPRGAPVAALLFVAVLAACSSDPAGDGTEVTARAHAGAGEPTSVAMIVVDDASAPPPDASSSSDAGGANGTFGNLAWSTTEVTTGTYETIITSGGAFFASIEGPFAGDGGQLFGLYTDPSNGNVQTGYPTAAELTPLTAEYGNFIAYMAAEVQGQLAGQLGDDHQGCDSPAGGFTASCGSCCDTHDICYCQNGCTSRSWFGLQGATCFGCNLSVTGCITACLANGGNRPSSCVAAGSCNQSWEQCDDEGTLCDPNANPAWGQCMEIHHANDGWSSVCNIEQCPKNAVAPVGAAPAAQ
jgi:hypothetical protein